MDTNHVDKLPRPIAMSEKDGHYLQLNWQLEVIVSFRIGMRCPDFYYICLILGTTVPSQTLKIRLPLFTQLQTPNTRQQSAEFNKEGQSRLEFRPDSMFKF